MPIQLPPSPSTPSATISIRAIDTTQHFYCPSAPYLTPTAVGHTTMNFPAVAFLLENKAQGKKILFDAGGRKDYWNYAPVVDEALSKSILGIRVEKMVDELLVEAGVGLEEIDGIVWSHWHFDHIGDTSRYPSSVKIIVGPGVVDTHFPGYPANPNSPLLETDYAGHEVETITFAPGPHRLQIGQFRAHDFFHDGSFYLLDVPGHATGHMCGLARTTSNPDTFMLLGADTCHYAGVMRPSERVPLPETLEHDAHALDAGIFAGREQPLMCPCSVFTECHGRKVEGDEASALVTPFYDIAENGAYEDPEVTRRSIKGLVEFDSEPDVLVCLAHDGGLFGVLPMLNDEPGAEIGDWKVKGYKEKARWGFMNELPREGKMGRKPIVEGYWGYGVEKGSFNGVRGSKE